MAAVALVLTGLALVLTVLAYLILTAPCVPDVAGGEPAEVVESVEVDPVTTPRTDWDDHVDEALAVVNAGRAYDITCRGCGRRVTGTREQVLAHLVDVHAAETPQQTALLNRYDQELTS